MGRTGQMKIMERLKEEFDGRITLLVIIIILIASIICYFFYSMSTQKLEPEYYSFPWSFIGALIGGLFTMLALVFTINSSKETQKQISNLQSALHVENNMNNKYDTISSTIAESIGNLDGLLLFVQNVKPLINSCPSYRENLFALYTRFRQSINNVRYKTEIYNQYLSCEGCTLCDIPMYGDLVKAKSIVLTNLFEVDKLCTNMVYNFSEALSSSIDSTEKIKGVKLNNDFLISNQHLMVKIQSQMPLYEINSTDWHALNQKLQEYQGQCQTINNEIAETNKQIKELTNIISEKNTSSRQMVEAIFSEHKLKLDNSIMTYLNLYKMYINQSFEFTNIKGSISKGCKKIQIK